MRKQQAVAAAQAAIQKAKTAPAGWWCVSYDRKGRAVRMFVPAK